jgi:hypothetical protein
MKEFNPSNLTATIEEINALDDTQLRELHKMYPTRKPYLKVSYSSKNQDSTGSATYGSLVGLRPLKKNVSVIGIVGAEIAEVKVTSETLAPVRSLKVETPETIEETPLNEGEVEISETETIETDSSEALEFAKAKYLEIHEKEVPKNKAKDLEWIQSKIS